MMCDPDENFLLALIGKLLKLYFADFQIKKFRNTSASERNLLVILFLLSKYCKAFKNLVRVYYAPVFR